MSLPILDILLAIDWSDIGLATLETADDGRRITGITVLLGLPLGIILFLTGPRQYSTCAALQLPVAAGQSVTVDALH